MTVNRPEHDFRVRGLTKNSLILALAKIETPPSTWVLCAGPDAARYVVDEVLVTEEDGKATVWLNLSHDVVDVKISGGWDAIYPQEGS